MRLWFVIFIACLAVPIPGAQYYVKYDTGNDANAGTSTGSPWKHAPGSSGATGVPAATTLVGGDTVFFHGSATSVYRATIFFNFSGTAGNPVIYDGTSWTGTRAHRSNTNTPNTSGFQTSGSTVRSNIFIHGFNIYDIGGWRYNASVFSGAPESITAEMAATRFGAGINFQIPALNITVSNNLIERIGHWTNVVQNTNGECIIGQGIVFTRGGTNIQILNNRISKMKTGISVSSRPGARFVNSRLAGNTLTNTLGWCIDINTGAPGSYYSNVVIETSLIGDFSEYDQANWLGGGDSPHTDGIFLRNGANAAANVWTNFVIRRNLFYTDDPGAPSNVGGTAGIAITQGPSARIENNIFANLRQPYSITVMHVNTLIGTQRVEILNNTFFNGRIRNATHSDFTTRRIVIEGNSFYRTGTGNTRAINIEQDYRILDSMDGNNYFAPSLTPSTWTVASLAGLDSSATFAELQALGYELEGTYGNPLYTNAVAPWRDANFRPREGSAMVNEGLNLTNIVTDDYAGTARAGLPLTIGAFVYGSSTPLDTNAPTPNPMTWEFPPAVVGQNTIGMTWTEATDDSGGTVTYTVTEVTGSPGCSGIVTTALGYTNNAVPLGTTCGYMVSASDPDGNTTTNSVTEFATVPAEPFEFAILMDSAAVTTTTVTEPEITTNLWYWDAEDGVTPSGWSDTGVVFWDHSQVVYQGLRSMIASNSILLSASSGPFTPVSSLTAVVPVNRDQPGTTPRRIWWLSNAVEEVAVVYMATNGIAFTHGTASNTISTHLPINNWYLLRIAYQSGTGADGLMNVAVADDLNWSSGLSNSIANGTSTGAVSRVTYGHQDSLPNNRFRYDWTWAKEGYLSIGDNPVP